MIPAENFEQQTGWASRETITSQARITTSERASKRDGVPTKMALHASSIDPKQETANHRAQPSTISTTASSTSSLDSMGVEDTFIGWHGGAATTSRQDGALRHRGTRPLNLISSSAPNGLSPPLMFAYEVERQGEDADASTTESHLEYVPLSTFYGSCLVCGQDMIALTGHSSRMPVCTGPAVQVEEDAGMIEAPPRYVRDWCARQRTTYWQAVLEGRRQNAETKMVQNNALIMQAAEGARLERNATETHERIVASYHTHHAGNYDYTFLVLTCVLFPYAWFVILVLYTTGWFLSDCFFWECCGSFSPRSHGCEQIVALDNGHVVCVRIFETGHAERTRWSFLSGRQRWSLNVSHPRFGASTTEIRRSSHRTRWRR